MTNGILYCAQGKRHFEEALGSLASSLRCNPVPHLVFTDQPPPSPAMVGVTFATQATCGHAFADKIEAMANTPFERTLYLDTDTYVAADVTGLFDLLSRFDLAIAHAPVYVGEEDPEVPAAFREFNSGVIAYRQADTVLRLLRDWRATYLAWLENPPFEQAARGIGKDQPALRRCAWKSGLSVYVLAPEYNYGTIAPGSLVGPAKIIHGRAADYGSLLAHLNRQSGPRCFPRLTQS
jgi:hypothetical protein